MAIQQDVALGSRARKGFSNHSGATELKLYGEMLRIRRTEEALMREYHPADEMRCPVHFCVGQEGPAAGILSHA